MSNQYDSSSFRDAARRKKIRSQFKLRFWDGFQQEKLLVNIQPLKGISMRLKVIGVLTLVSLVSMFSLIGCEPKSCDPPQPAPAGDAEIIGSESLTKITDRMLYAMVVNRAPGADETARVNPPRFRWSYIPDVTKLTGQMRVLYKFQLQIADEPTFSNPIVDQLTDINFFNELGPLPENKTYFWRVGYLCQMASWDGEQVDVPREVAPGVWSDIRSFHIAKGTPKWDRSLLGDPPLPPHPRMVFRGDQIAQLRKTIETDPIANKTFYEDIIPSADKLVESQYWNNWPDTDERGKLPWRYFTAGKWLTNAAMAYVITDDPKYSNIVNIFAKIATFPRGGGSSPEGMGGDAGEDSTSFTEYLALAYTWLYDKYTPAQRTDIVKSLEWRIDAWMNDFRWGGSWYTTFEHEKFNGKVVRRGSQFLAGGDHQWEGSMSTFPAAIAIYEDSEIARRFFHIIANYLIAVGERPAQNGQPDQGLSYGMSHLKWQMYQTAYLMSALPDLSMGMNPHYHDIGSFYNAIMPVGLKGAPWGRYDPNGSYQWHKHESFRLLAMMTGDGVMMQHWLNGNPDDGYNWRPWVHVAAPLIFGDEPEPTTGSQRNFVFPQSGWVMSHTSPPIDPKAFTDGVGIIFGARPCIGQNGNVFYNNNTMQLYAYGQMLNYGGGPGGEDAQPFHTMGHNTILVDGIGQAPTGKEVLEDGLRGGIFAYKLGDDFVYWMGDATGWYPKTPARVSTWKIRFEKEVYGTLALPYLQRFRRHVLFMRNKYLVVLDDLATNADKPARFSWLWHVQQDGNITYDDQSGRLTYPAGDVKVIIQHIANAGQLDFEHRKKFDGLVNPITGEDFHRNPHTMKELEKPDSNASFPAHHFWFTNKTQASNFHFLTVIFPIKPGSGEPKITRLDDLTVMVEADGQTDVISYDPNTKFPATHVVDLPGLSGQMKLP